MTIQTFTVTAYVQDGYDAAEAAHSFMSDQDWISHNSVRNRHIEDTELTYPDDVEENSEDFILDRELTDAEIEKRDLIDNAINALFVELGLPNDSYAEEHISEVRNAIIAVFNLDEATFYPYIKYMRKN